MISKRRRYINTERILKKYDYICGYCFERKATTVDHILPVAYREIDTDDNLIAACRDCNAIAGAMVFENLEEKRIYIQDVLKTSQKWIKKRKSQLPDSLPQRLPASDKAKMKKPKETKLKVDKPKAVRFEVANAPQMLSELIREFGHEPTLISVDALQTIADKLSAVAGKEPVWSWRYLRNVLNNKLRASQNLIAAILALGATVDGVPDTVARAHPVQVLAVGHVAPGAVILADSKPCARPGCPVHFVPCVPSQRYCSPDCKKQMRSLRARKGGI